MLFCYFKKTLFIWVFVKKKHGFFKPRQEESVISMNDIMYLKEN